MGLDTFSVTTALISIFVKGFLGIEEITKLPEGVTMEEITKDIKQQDISLQLAQQQARFAQELAIALRIETAEEVEVEEFYDNLGEGNAGLKAAGDNMFLGIGGSGRRISKRIYKFKGHNGEKIEVYQQKLDEVLAPKTKIDDK